MNSPIASALPFELLERLTAMPIGEGWLALAFFAIAASAYATGIPGTLLPISFSSGLLLGSVPGMIAVAAGALLGAVTLYLLLERGSRATLRRKYAKRLVKFDALAARGGIAPLIGLRLAGVPHLALTGLCALAAIGPKRYALATAVGLFPAIALSSIAGATI